MDSRADALLFLLNASMHISATDDVRTAAAMVVASNPEQFNTNPREAMREAIELLSGIAEPRTA
jgi:hypothetical protein